MKLIERRGIAALQKGVADGKIIIDFAVTPKIKQSISNIRNLTNGTVDLKTVDNLVRSMARTVQFIDHRNSLKKVATLREIQTEYVGYIRANFGDLFDDAVKQKFNPHNAALSISHDPEAVKVFEPQIVGFLETIKEFWKNFGDAATAHVADSPTFKSAFGGDLFPSYRHNIASAVGLYVDTLIIPDPFIRTEVIFSRVPPERKVYYLIKHAFQILNYEKLLLADVDPPIVAILPEDLGIPDARKDFLINRAEQDATALASKIFGQPFESAEDLEKYLKNADDQQVIEKIKRPERILFDVDWKGSLPEQFKRAIEHAKADNMAYATTVADNITRTLFARMAQINDVVFRSQTIRATPLIDAPTSWQYFVWKLEADAERASLTSKAQYQPLHTVKGLQNAAAGEMKWLGNIDADALIEMRKQGVLPELRELLGKGIDEIAIANPANFYRTSDAVFDNIHRAFDEHNKKIRQLSEKRWKFAGRDIGLSLVHGTVEFASAIGIPLVSLINTFIDQTAGTPKYKEIPEQYKKLKAEGQKLNNSAAGLLFRLKRDE